MKMEKLLSLRIQSGFSMDLGKIALGFLLFFPAGCDSVKERPPKDAVAVINGHAVTIREYHDALKRLIPKGEALTKEEFVELKKGLINRLIEEELIEAEAEKAGLSVSAEELGAEIEAMKGEYGNVPFAKTIRERYGSLDNWKEEIRRKLIIKKAIDKEVNSGIKIGEAQAKAYYEGHVSEYDEPEKVKARMIVVGSEEEAKKIKARSTVKNFPELAKELSISPDAENGGDLGFFARGDMPEEFEEAVFKLKPGEISPVVKTGYGFHIFLLEEKKNGGRLAFEDVREDIMEKLRNEASEEKLNRWITVLKAKAKIDIVEELL